MIELLVNLPSPIPKLQHAPLPTKCCEPKSASTPSPSVVFTFGFVVESIKELGDASGGVEKSRKKRCVEY
jgi:hypothetical protein